MYILITKNMRVDCLPSDINAYIIPVVDMQYLTVAFVPETKSSAAPLRLKLPQGKAVLLQSKVKLPRANIALMSEL